MRKATVDELLALGFDRSHTVCEGTVVVCQCSQCAVTIVNGTAIHERGCPNEMHECAECGAMVAKRYRLCDDCGGNLLPGDYL